MGNRRGAGWLAAACAALLVVPASAAAQDVPDAERMVAKINEVRARHGLPAYAFSGLLSDSSRRFARWQMRTDRFGHVERIRADGSWLATGEALEWHSGHRVDVRGAVRRWMRSPGHAALLLSPTFRAAGAGISRGLLGRTAATIWVLQLGQPAPRQPAPSLPSGL